MDELTVAILKVLKNTSELDEVALLKETLPFWRESVYKRLTTLWKNGKVYVSEVEHTEDGYQPIRWARWSLERRDGYYQYRERTGLVRIGPEDTSPVELLLEATLNPQNPIYSVAASPNGDHFVVGDGAGKITIGSLRLGTVTRTIQAHEERVWAVDYSPDGSVFVSGSEDGRIILWNADGDQIGVVGEVDEWVTSLSFSPEGDHILSGHRVQGSREEAAVVRCWSVKELGKAQSLVTYMPHEKGNVYSVSFLPSGRGIVSSGSDSTVRYYSFDKQQTVVSDKHSGTVFCLAVHPTSDVVITGGQYGTIKLWDSVNDLVLHSIEAHTSRVTALTLSPDGQLLASGGKDSRIAIWKIPEGTLLADTTAHVGWVRGLTFTASSNTLISGGSDGLCKIWRLVGYR